MKKSIFAILLGFIIFSGCSNKQNNSLNIIHENAISSTQKARVGIEDKSSILITATYLNNLKYYLKNENELIVFGIYHSDKSQNGTNLGKLEVFINGKSADIQELVISDEMISFLPSSNSWNKYYLASIPKEKENIKELFTSILIYPFPVALITFQKDF